MLGLLPFQGVVSLLNQYHRALPWAKSKPCPFRAQANKTIFRKAHQATQVLRKAHQAKQVVELTLIYWFNFLGIYFLHQGASPVSYWIKIVQIVNYCQLKHQRCVNIEICLKKNFFVFFHES